MKILIAGDFCPQHRVNQLFEKGDFASVLENVIPIINSVDYSIVNFECPITTNIEKPIEKCGPNLRCSKKGIEALKWAGFNCVTLANNHFLDYGVGGAKNTIETCQKYGVDTVGGGMNLQEASAIFYKEVRGKALAVINCCEHEFSIATETTAGSNPLNPIQQYYAIREARQKADYVLVIVHGGHEHYQLPSPRMQETYRFFIDAGADAVVNHHQHCFSGYEVYKDKPIFYGLGNFCFDKVGKNNHLWNRGLMVSIVFEDQVQFNILPFSQCGDEPIVKLADIEEIKNEIDMLNTQIASSIKLQAATQEYYAQNAKLIEKHFQPFFGSYIGRGIAKLQQKRMLPSLLSKRQLLKFRNLICCEAHYDKVRFFLESRQFSTIS